MVVQSGQHGAAARVEQSLAGPHGEVVAHLVDLRADPDVGDGAVQQGGPPNQHDRQRLSATRRRTASLSAPSSDAGLAAAGAGGGGAGWLQFGDRRQRGIGRGDRGHRHLDQLAAAAAQRFGHRLGRLQPGERVGDGVAAEHRVVGAAADQAAGHRGVVAERRPARALVIPGDPQPDSARRAALHRPARAGAAPAPPAASLRSRRRRPPAVRAARRPGGRNRGSRKACRR